MRPLYCEDAQLTFFNLLDFSIAPPLLYYAYVPVLILTVILAVLALHYNKRDRNSVFFSLLAAALVVHVIFVFFTWIAAPISLVMFSWQIWPLTFALLFAASFAFIYTFVLDRQLPPGIYVPLLFFLLPIALLLPTDLNVAWFDLSWCEGVFHGTLITYTYIYAVALLLGILAVGLYAHFVPSATNLSKKYIWVIVASSAVFLLAFLATAYIGDLTGIYEFEVIGPLCALLFLAGMAYVAVNYKKFEIKVLGTELLIIGLITVLGSILFVHSLEYVRYVAGGSLILVLILGWILSRSIRREIEQRKRIEELAKNLEKANKRLKILDQMKSEFVSIASHQLRSPLTSIRGYASMLLEGSFGKLPQKAQNAVERIAESSRYMALSVEDYLNVSRIESGRMKYEMSDFNIKDTVERIVDDVRPTAVKKGLMLTFKSAEMKTSGLVYADIGKTQQIVHNLLDNAMKYTERGSIKARVYDDKKRKRAYVEVSDTGVGMDKETQHEVFEKFVRARNANQVNVTGTGLGLYVAKQMAEGMGGSISVSSPGEEKGSTFTLELPLSDAR